MEMDIAAFREVGIDEITTALSKDLGTAGGMAVTGAPFAGRNLLLDHIEATVDDVTRVSLSPGSDLDDIPWPDGGTLLVQDAHHLYQRSIGGFDVLESFLSRCAESDSHVVTSWNRFAWEYLVQTHDVDQMFPTAITAPTFSPSQLAALIEAIDERTIMFKDDRDRNDQAIERAYHELTVRGRELRLPYPRVNREAVRSWRKSDDPVEEAIFDRIASRSDGNAGVAVALWEESVEDNTISFGNLHSPPDADLRQDEAALLNRLIRKEQMQRSGLDQVIDDPQRALASLERQGLLRYTDSRAGLEPVAVPSIIAALQRRRLLW